MTRRITKPALKRSTKQWAELVGAWKRSGQSSKEFAATRGLSAATLSWWAWRIRRSGAAPRRARAKKRHPVRLVEVSVEQTSTRASTSGWKLSSVAGIDLEVQGELSVETLAVVLGAMGGRR